MCIRDSCQPIAGAGTITIGQNSAWTNPSGNPANFQMYIYGTTAQNEIELDNSSFIAGAVYAPQSHVVFKNTATFTGGLSAKIVEFKNSVDFSWDPTLADLRGRTVTKYYRTAWRECRREATVVGDAGSGC